MNFSWTLFISVLTLVNILACFWLLWWTRKKKPSTQDGDSAQATTGHVWDGDLREYNKPLPKWWLNMFYISIVFSLGYLVIFPGLGAFAGTQSWSSAKQHDEDVAVAEAKLKPLFAKYSAITVADLARDEGALALGRSVFANNCVQCHGSDARGAKGFPNLTDADWLWGSDAESVLASILNGRNAAMPAWGAVLGEQGVKEVAVYVQGLSGQTVDATMAASGQARFTTTCVACHGPEGKGNVQLGAPNLTDNIWLYGGDYASIVTSIQHGRQGKMPAHETLIGKDRARLAAAWVLAQSESSHQSEVGSH
jgi:cytochrome c oxidase cbb3-type subunit 3